MPINLTREASRTDARCPHSFRSNFDQLMAVFAANPQGCPSLSTTISFYPPLKSTLALMRRVWVANFGNPSPAVGRGDNGLRTLTR